MILDLDTLADLSDPRLQPDVCIVGGGAVGLVLADALTRQGVKVLVLEGGGAHLETGSQALQRGTSVGHPFKNIEVGRYRLLGGTTAFWGGQLYPFDAFVTGARPWLGHAAWPVPAEEMPAWYGEAYRVLGLGNAILDDAAVWPAIGHLPPALGPDIEMVTTRWVKMRNFARLFGPALRQAGGPHALLHANVTGFQMDGTGRRVEAATVRSLKGRTLQVRARRFVLANGSLEIARLLLHPLANGGPAPWHASPWVGMPLVDHLDCIAGQVHVHDHARFHDLFDSAYVGGQRYYPRMRMAPAAQRRHGAVDIAALFLYRTRFSEHLEYLKMFLRSVREGSGGVALSQVPKHLAVVAATAWPLALRYFRDRRSFKPHDAEVSLALNCEQLPSARSRITLGSERDALGQQRLQVDWQIDGRELDSMRLFAHTVADALAAQGVARVDIDARLEAGDPAFLACIEDAIHQMGTARMATDASQGVVDAQQLVFNTDNLYITGAAVFPSTGFANPTFTAIALSLRLAAHLAAQAPAQALT